MSDETKVNIIKLTRLRILSNFINFIVTPLLLVPISLIVSMFQLNDFNFSGISAFLLIATICIFVFILHFGIFVKLTNGYTIGGLVTGLRIVKLDGEKLEVMDCTKRFLNGWNRATYFYAYMYTKVNSIGQFYYDEKFNTTIIRRGREIPKKINIKNYEHNYAKEFILIFIVLYLVLFGIEQLF